MANMSDAVYCLLQYIAAREPGGVELWPLGEKGCSRATRARARMAAFTHEITPRGPFRFSHTHITEVGRNAMNMETARRAAMARRAAAKGKP